MISHTEHTRPEAPKVRRGIRELFHSTFGNAMKDERLNAIRYKAASVGFIVSYALTFAVLIVMEFVDTPERVSYKTLLMIPLLGGCFANMIYLWIKRYPEAVQEVWTRSADGRKIARNSVIFQSLLSSIFYYAGLRLFPGILDTKGGVTDIVLSLAMGIWFGLVMWWDLARTRKKHAAARDNGKV